MSQFFSNSGPTTVNTQRQLEAKILLSLNSGGGGGGGGGNNPVAANYGGGTPTPVPTSNEFAVDTSNNALWVWFGAAWHNTGIRTG